MCGKDIAMIFQEPMSSLNPVFTVGYQIGEVLRQHMGMSGGRRGRARWRCWKKWAFPIRPRRSTPIRARCPAASSSA
jgi:ABC-type microcin C transport system duplicated ATPase subunit YejF